MLSKVRLLATSLGIAFLMAGCIKSDRPIRFQGNRIASVNSTVLGSSVGAVNDTGIIRARQLRTEGDTTYLYSCSEPGSPLQKIQTTLYGIPNHEGYFILSLQEGDFFFDDSGPGHEVFIVRPTVGKMHVWIISGDDSETARNFLRNTQSVSSGVRSEADLKTFLTNSLAAYVAEKTPTSYQYFRGNLNSCDF